MEQEEKEAIELLVRKANKLAAQQKLDESIEVLEQVLDRDPENVGAWDVLGFVRYFKGDVEGATECCRKSLLIKPDGAYAHKGLGICLAEQGELDEGVAALEKAIELRPGWGDPHHDLGVVLFKAGYTEKAIPHFEKAAELSPKSRSKLLKMVEQLRAKLE